MISAATPLPHLKPHKQQHLCTYKKHHIYLQQRYTSVLTRKTATVHSVNQENHTVQAQHSCLALAEQPHDAMDDVSKAEEQQSKPPLCYSHGGLFLAVPATRPGWQKIFSSFWHTGAAKPCRQSHFPQPTPSKLWWQRFQSHAAAYTTRMWIRLSPASSSSQQAAAVRVDAAAAPAAFGILPLPGVPGG